jgi:hypothetical protein
MEWDFFTKGQTVWLLPDPIWHRGPHVSLVVYGVKTSKEAYAWVQAVFQMINDVYPNDI